MNARYRAQGRERSKGKKIAQMILAPLLKSNTRLPQESRRLISLQNILHRDFSVGPDAPLMARARKSSGSPCSNRKEVFPKPDSAP